MPTLAPANPAEVIAAAHWQTNRAALARRQPSVADALDQCDVVGQWVTARDGTPTTRAEDGQWFAGCSVPRLAGRALLRSLVPAAGGHCLLAPAHTGLVMAARERLGPTAVLFILQPDAAACRVMLGSADLAADLSAGRLWIATGRDWADHLAAMFADHRGLATPAQFVRTKLTADADVDPLVGVAQTVFGDVATARVGAIAQLRTEPTGRPLVVCRSAFSLWDCSAALADAVGGDRYDLDDPLTAAPLALAAAAAGASMVVAADLGRGDAAPVVPMATPWVTWMTRPAPPPPVAAAGPADRVVVADPAWVATVVDAGWPADRVGVGRCPSLVQPSPAGRQDTVAILADTAPIVMPESVKAYSTHGLLWDAVAAELHADPTAAADPAAYLADRAARHHVDPSQLDPAAFHDGLIGPAYVQGLARIALADGVLLAVWGAGWDELPEFADRAAGPVESADQFAAAVSAAAALIRPVHGHDWHPVEACGRPVLIPDGLTSPHRDAAGDPLAVAIHDALPIAA